MLKNTRAILVRLTLSVFLLSLTFQASEAQVELKFENEFNYILEALTVTTPLNTKHTEFLGWLHNMSTLRLGEKHSINLSVMITHDNMPSALRVRDLQTFSNIEAGNLYGFNEVFYQFETEKLTVKVGGQDINSDFFVTENGLLFTHSSMGIDPVATINMPAPTYPFTAFSINAAWQIKDQVKLRAGFFDGQFANARDRFLPISWTLNNQQGLIYVFEPEFSFFKNRMITKLGAYHHSGRFIKKDNSGIGNFWGFYNISDIQIHQMGRQSINFYYQINKSTNNLSDLDFYYGIGFRFVNLLNIEQNNQLGVGIAHASLNTQFQSVINEYGISSETVLEINWLVTLSKQISLQPYFQFINIKDIGNDFKEPVVFAFRGYLTL